MRSRLSQWVMLCALLAACKGRDTAAPAAGAASGASGASSRARVATNSPGGPQGASGSASAASGQVAPPVDLAAPPPGATKLASGMVFLRLTTTTGPTPGQNDTIDVHITGWKVASKETTYTTRVRGTPMPLDLASAGPGFVEVFTQVRQGERVMMWMPAELVGKNQQGAAEALAFEAELVGIRPAPAAPADVAGPPATARTAAGGVRFVVAAPPAGGERARNVDTVSFHYTLWDAAGRMLASTERRGRPVSSPLFRQPRAIESLLLGAGGGQRLRAWLPAAALEPLAQMVRVPGELPTGQLCLELAVLGVERGGAPPAPPRELSAAPARARKTSSGLAYQVMRAGTGSAHPGPSDQVRVHYTGWTSDGHLFDTTAASGQPATLAMSGVIRGWAEGLATMVVGERTRFWIPAELAYQGQAGKPQGLLVFEVELVEIVASADPHGADPHAGGGHDGHGH